ncbi:MAG: hypothetical protein ABI618_16565 [Nitrospirota bacterium]
MIIGLTVIALNIVVQVLVIIFASHHAGVVKEEAKCDIRPNKKIFVKSEKVIPAGSPLAMPGTTQRMAFLGDKNNEEIKIIPIDRIRRIEVIKHLANVVSCDNILEKISGKNCLETMRQV